MVKCVGPKSMVILQPQNFEESMKICQLKK